MTRSAKYISLSLRLTTVGQCESFPVLLGRQATCDICINNTKISSIHCQIFRVDLEDGATQSVIRDHSTNGTFVNSKKLIKHKVYKLHNGDEITFVEVPLLACIWT